MRPFSIIVAMDEARGIGKNGTLPWRLPGDLKHFKQLTCATDDPDKRNAVIMGRKTWDSIPPKFRPLPDRLNVVLTRNKDLKLPEGVIAASKLEEAFDALEDWTQKETAIENVFVIGGAQIFDIALASPGCEKLYVTRIRRRFDCDAFFPHFESTFNACKTSSDGEEDGIRYYFAEYRRREP